MPEGMDREIEEQLEEALEKALTALGVLWREEEDEDTFDLSDLSDWLDRSPTIGDVGSAISKIRATAELFREQAETLSSWAGDLDEWIEPLASCDLRDLVREKPEAVAQLLIGWAYVLAHTWDGREHSWNIDEAVEGVGDIPVAIEEISDFLRRSSASPVARSQDEAG